jgi:hypothetical protein
MNMRKIFLLLLYALSGCNDLKERAIASEEEAEAKFENGALWIGCGEGNPENAEFCSFPPIEKTKAKFNSSNVMMVVKGCSEGNEELCSYLEKINAAINNKTPLRNLDFIDCSYTGEEDIMDVSICDLQERFGNEEDYGTFKDKVYGHTYRCLDKECNTMKLFRYIEPASIYQTYKAEYGEKIYYKADFER